MRIEKGDSTAYNLNSSLLLNSVFQELIYLTEETGMFFCCSNIRKRIHPYIKCTSFCLMLSVSPFRVTCKFWSRDHAVRLLQLLTNTEQSDWVASESTPLTSYLKLASHVYLAICLVISFPISSRTSYQTSAKIHICFSDHFLSDTQHFEF